MSELEKTVGYLRSTAIRNRYVLFWSAATLGLILLLVRVREVATLLLAAYGLAILLDPLVNHFERKGISRTTSILCFGGGLLIIMLGVVGVAIPSFVREYQQFSEALPSYVQKSSEKLDALLAEWTGGPTSAVVQDLSVRGKEYVSEFGGEQLRAIGKGISRTLLQGYSIALTLLNLFLLPFFVFYLTRDLKQFHRSIGRFMSPDIRRKAKEIGQEILKHVHAFFRGQLTVCVILAVLYIIGLSLCGMPWSVLIGTLTGLLNIVPYLGVGLGLALSTLVTLVSDPSLAQFGKVYGVFLLIQAVEGNFITPKIVGESVGIHPLVVMVALVVGGEFFGLLGLVIAIPAAAAIRVLFTHAMQALDQIHEDDEEPKVLVVTD